MQSKELTNYDFGKGYFGFFWKVFGIQKVWCLFICVIIPRQFVIRKRSQISGGHLPKLFCDSFPTKNQQTDMHKKWVVLSLSSQKAKRSGRLTSDMSKGQFLPQRSRAGVMAFHQSDWTCCLYSPGFHVSPLLGQVCFICCHCHNERAETLSVIFDLGLICCFQTLVWGSSSRVGCQEDLLTSITSAPSF